MDGYESNLPGLKDSFAALYQLTLDRYTKSAVNPETVPIVAFFRLFPLQPTSDVIRDRLFARGVITVSQASGTVHNSGRAILASFQDATFGLIQIQFGRTLDGAVAKDGAIIRVTVAGGVPCEIQRVPDLLGYSSHLVVTQIAFHPAGVEYRFREREGGGAEFYILVTGDPPDHPKTTSGADVLSITDIMTSTKCDNTSTENACWWIYKSRFDANAGRKRCFLKHSSRDEDDVCTDPDDNIGSEMRIDGPFQSRSEAQQSMEHNPECHD